IFDLVRAALQGRFFKLIKAFARPDSKLSLEQIADSGGFDELQSHVIEEELKRLYLKDLLHKLTREWKVECTDESIGQKFVHLVELVQRRNLHVHNRGIVDEKYLERDQ